ncbi:MAG: hypothetical protein HOB79_09115 [Rhodospirillaceae bacterium]|jgi:putative tricarboxylic transport membrane protein|nr:hypothetical protein [Rhodospirillales bacterium]MBT3907482.1 hypothetical protein [Rhodospirillaceae bacterium]MBT4701226.1 hypothetical protein [Rhodospirillaceae bacterium]MBT5035547.1 hypothetical protein [Rhodospirillaceae bacterium]MBT6219082.1 hypothetical protein [Rhodospirillaceae bacterium]
MDDEETAVTSKVLLTTGDLFAVGAVLAGTLYLLYETFSMSPPMLPGYPGDSFFPRLSIVLILMCGVPLIFTRYRDHVMGRGELEGEKDETFSIDIRGFLIVTAVALSFPFLLPIFGFEIVTFSILTLWFATRFNEYVTAETMTTDIVVKVLVRAAVMALVTMCLLYFIFVIMLNVSMPVMFFPKYIDFGL